MRVRVHPLTDAERVTAIRVSLTPAQGDVLHLDLDPSGPGSTAWSQSRAVPPGTYTATALASDASETPLFHSDPTAAFEIKSEQVTSVDIFLRQFPDDPAFVPPHLLSVNLDRPPVVGEQLEIVVRGDGGVGSLSLSGDGAGSFGSSSGNAKSQGGASIAWTPNLAGMRTILLTLTDQDENTATAAVEVKVVADGEGEVNFTVHFNHAPHATIHSEATSSATHAEVELTARFFDEEPGLIDYSWDFADCATEGLVHDELTSELPTGSAAQDSPRRFLLEATAGGPRSCTATLTLTDLGNPPAKQVQQVLIRTEPPTPGCEEGKVECFGACTDLQTDREHCGACYQLCGAGEDCVGGSCVQVCPGALAYCDGQCLDTESNPAACGNCYTTCRVDQICSEGTCACPAGWPLCGDTCTDTSSDSLHCGGCDQACVPDRQCEGGACVCTPPLESCAGTCVDKSQDDQNCGACGNTCPAGQHCDGGTCACDDSNLLACGALCVDPQTNDDFCGDCETACGESEICQGGNCVPEPCPPGQMPCGAGGACVDTTENEDHCGACNETCITGDLCINSVCMPDPEHANWPVPSEDPPNAQYDYTSDPNVVLDLTTRLMWERNVVAVTRTWQEAFDYCAGIDVGGFTDWRLPTRIELISITKILNGSDTYYGPAINRTAFPSTSSIVFWTNSMSKGWQDRAWQVDFNDGDTAEVSLENKARVRCVRYGPGYRTREELGLTRYEDTVHAGVPYVKDNYTGLLWRKSQLPTLVSRSAADTNCKAEASGGKQARLPFRKELETLVDPRRINPTFDDSFFSGASDWHWTNTFWGLVNWVTLPNCPVATQCVATFYWTLRLSLGRSDGEGQVVSLYARCVAPAD